MPEGLEIERKWKVEQVPAVVPGGHRKLRILQLYLSSPEGTYERVRTTLDMSTDTVVRTHNIKKDHPEPGVSYEDEREINDDEWKRLRCRLSDDHHPVEKDRYVFEHAGETFELDVFAEPLRGLVLLELEGSRIGDEVELPPWLGPMAEVTGDVAYSNYQLSKKADTQESI